MEIHALDQPDFYESLLKHLIRDPQTMKDALELGVTADDFMATSAHGNRTYQVFASIALKEANAPIDEKMFGLLLKERLNSGALDQNLFDGVVNLWNWIYNDPITPGSYSGKIRDFVKRRREEKARLEIKNADELRDKLNAIQIDLSQNDILKVSVVNPFDELILPTIEDIIPTGFRKVDRVAQGLARGDYGLILGFTGSGKTAAASQMMTNLAIQNYKVSYMAMEDTVPNMALRCYSRLFKMSYSALRSGSMNSSLRTAFDAPEHQVHTDILRKNIKLFGLKEAAPLTAEQLYRLSVQRFEETGFVPDVKLVDQMQFLRSSRPKKGEERWQEEERISAECDEMSHKTIGGRRFAVWVLHQVKGKVKLRFTREDTQGFKGIDQKADVVMGIGRDGVFSNDFLFFSLKCRHTANFEIKQKGNLEFMTFEDPLDDLTPETGNTSLGQENDANRRSQLHLTLIQTPAGVAATPA